MIRSVFQHSRRVLQTSRSNLPRGLLASHSNLMQIRSFQSHNEYQKWRKDILESTLKTTCPHSSTMTLQALPLSEGAPFLDSVSPMAEHLELAGFVDSTQATKPLKKEKTPRDSFLQCTYPLKEDEMLRNYVADFSSFSSFRLGKFYEIVDALTADVAYRHCAVPDDDNRHESGVTLVTAGHYHSRKFERTRIEQDVILRCYVTTVGRSSMEVRTDVLQLDPETGDERLINVCHTVMVALDPISTKPLSKVGRRLPTLIAETPDDEKRLDLAEQHQQIRQERSSKAMLLRSPASAPPSLEEMTELHKLHRLLTLQQEQTSSSKGMDAPTVKDYTFRSSTIIFPEQRNVHGKMFGGFVMGQAQNLAQYTATFFAKGQPIIPIGIDEAIFLQPVALRDMITFTARLVHSTAHTCRVLVTVETRDPEHADCLPRRSNRLMFVFAGTNFRPGIIPETYQEILMHIDAQRRYQVEGPLEEEIQVILQGNL